MEASLQFLCFHAIYLSLIVCAALKFCHHVSPVLAKDRHVAWFETELRSAVSFLC